MLPNTTGMFSHRVPAYAQVTSGCRWYPSMSEKDVILILKRYAGHPLGCVVGGTSVQQNIYLYLEKDRDCNMAAVNQIN